MLLANGPGLSGTPKPSTDASPKRWSSQTGPPASAFCPTALSSLRDLVSWRGVGECHASFHQIGWYLLDRSRGAEARPLFDGRWRSTRRALGPDHPDTATSWLIWQAFTRPRGGYKEAEPLLKTSLGDRRKGVGPRIIQDTATSLGNLASLTGPGAVQGGRAVMESSAGDPQKALGPHHPDTATSLNNWRVFTRPRGSTRKPSRY